MNINELHELATILNHLQSLENKGMGVSAIRGTCVSLFRGDFEGAKQGIKTDWDKIRNYPLIARTIKKHIFPNEKYLGYEELDGKWIE